MSKENNNNQDNVEMLNQELRQELEDLRSDLENNASEEFYSKRRFGSNNRKHKKKKKAKIRPFRVLITILCILLFLIVIAVGALFYLRYQGKKSLSNSEVEEEISGPDGADIDDDGKVVIYNGEKYCYNENVINILCMGIDTSIEETGDDTIGENGQADVLFLVVLDQETGEMSLINISRDTMIDVDKYNVYNQYLGTENMQICLAYAYGDGQEESCLNVSRSVSRLLYGMPIHAYVALEYEGISVLNDTVGGVTVNVLEDLTSSDPELEEGAAVTLTGQQAETYVRTRDTEVLDSNNARMVRQRQYLLAFMNKTLEETKSDISFPLSLYQIASDYMVTDIGASEATYLASLALGNGFSEGDIYPVSGEIVMGETYAEFNPDEEALYELILDVFYNKE